MIAAQQLDVAGYISVAGAGRSFYTILQDQLSQQLPEEMLQSTMAKLDSIKNGYTVTTYSPMLGSLLRESVQPYLREMMSYQPSSEISKVEVPVLILQGGSDLQITEEDANTLYNARPESTYHLYPEMNHVLKRVQSEEENKASYTDPDFPLDFNISADIASWIERQ
ncbi:MAG: alpha/beta hydrolase [Owenweeksia sp.]|nr:alpha/beta hydrolase [Owenweeksia sp.]